MKTKKKKKRKTTNKTYEEYRIETEFTNMPPLCNIRSCIIKTILRVVKYLWLSDIVSV